ncbi:hypothetical protein GGQ85_000760 [Nitrobacter vulgaris]|nr:hypothetical protein [Nitrobacter vulgaris]
MAARTVELRSEPVVSGHFAPRGTSDAAMQGIAAGFSNGPNRI